MYVGIRTDEEYFRYNYFEILEYGSNFIYIRKPTLDWRKINSID